jgi:hypothetical protein
MQSRNGGIIYLLSEIVVLLLVCLDHYLLHKANSIFFNFIGELVLLLSITGICLGVFFFILWKRKSIETKWFIRQIVFISIGVILPFIFLYSVLAQLG